MRFESFSLRMDSILSALCCITLSPRLLTQNHEFALSIAAKHPYVSHLQTLVTVLLLAGCDHISAKLSLRSLKVTF